jgi:hypothetical protein
MALSCAIKTKKPNSVFSDIGVNTKHSSCPKRESTVKRCGARDLIAHAINVENYAIAIDFYNLSVQSADH